MTEVPASHVDLLEQSDLRPPGHDPAGRVTAEQRHVVRLGRVTDPADPHQHPAEIRQPVSREPRVALSIADPDDQYRFLEIRGTVETIEADPGAEFYRSLQRRYGMDYPILDGDVRVIITIRPDRYVAVRGGTVVGAEA